MRLRIKPKHHCSGWTPTAVVWQAALSSRSWLEFPHLLTTKSRLLQVLLNLYAAHKQMPAYLTVLSTLLHHNKACSKAISLSRWMFGSGWAGCISNRCSCQTCIFSCLYRGLDLLFVWNMGQGLPMTMFLGLVWQGKWVCGGRKSSRWFDQLICHCLGIATGLQAV